MAPAKSKALNQRYLEKLKIKNALVIFIMDHNFTAVPTREMMIPFFAKSPTEI